MLMPQICPLEFESKYTGLQPDALPSYAMDR
jgi:hypothetical protein